MAAEGGQPKIKTPVVVDCVTGETREIGVGRLRDRENSGSEWRSYAFIVLVVLILLFSRCGQPQLLLKNYSHSECGQTRRTERD